MTDTDGVVLAALLALAWLGGTICCLALCRAAAAPKEEPRLPRRVGACEAVAGTLPAGRPGDGTPLCDVLVTR